MKTATADEMREMDRIAIQERGIPSCVLMERAAAGVAAAARKWLSAGGGSTAAVFCGPGNNGGDGVAAARLLREAGVTVRAFLVGSREKMTPDTREMERRLALAGGILEDFSPNREDQRSFTVSAGVIVDALFGIGLNAPVRGPGEQAVALINESPAPVVSADIPSGVSADTGAVLKSAVRAAETVTFSMAKPGLLAGDGALYAGKLTVYDIGIPQDLINAQVPKVRGVTGDLVKSWLPGRPADGHKGTFGRAFLLCGSSAYTGAPVLAAEGALRSGAGLIYLGVPEEIYTVTAVRCREVMPVSLPSRQGALEKSCIPEMLDRAARCDAVLAGPGLGRSDGAKAAVLALLENVQCPLVLDADGINAAAAHKDKLSAPRSAPLILTPHDGEFARLGGDLSSGDRIAAARELAYRYQCVLLLKGHRTVVASPDGAIYVNQTGNAGMAKGGSGDVLSGIILSLLAQGMPPLEAAAAGAWVHGRAGDLCAQELSQRGMTPTDMIRALPRVWKELE